MNQNEQKSINKSKKKLIVILTVAISVALITIISAVIYNYLFKDRIQKQEKEKQRDTIWSSALEENKKISDSDRKASSEIAKKHSIDVCGKYVNVYNELAETTEADKQAGATSTQAVTTVMMVKDDNTIDFADGRIGWWLLSESEEGIVHMGIGVEGSENIDLYMVCEGTLIGVNNGGILFGTIPAQDRFDAELTDGNLTLTFKKDGTLNGEYIEMVEEDGQTFPWTELYRGEYRKNDMYMDIALNGSTARYIIFSTKTNNPDKTVSGIAARYYVKADA